MGLRSISCEVERGGNWSCHERAPQRKTPMILGGMRCALSGRMEKIDDYKKLVAWQLSMELGDLIDETQRVGLLLPCCESVARRDAIASPARPASEVLV